MITKQLRLGNWIQGFRTFKDGKKTYDPPMQVVTLTEGYLYADIDGNEGDPFEYVFDEVEGVPLTEELLLQFGFEKTPTGSMGLWFVEGVEGLIISDIASSIYAGGDLCSIQHIRYLHDLQNLYFSLCGQELQTPTRWL